jgi:hypothetical protein
MSNTQTSAPQFQGLYKISFPKTPRFENKSAFIQQLKQRADEQNIKFTTDPEDSFTGHGILWDHLSAPKVDTSLSGTLTPTSLLVFTASDVNELNRFKATKDKLDQARTEKLKPSENRFNRFADKCLKLSKWLHTKSYTLGKMVDNGLLGLMAVTSMPLHNREARLLKADEQTLKNEFAPLLKKVQETAPILNLAAVQQALTERRFDVENGVIRSN